MAQDTVAGAGVYSPLVLRGYDLWVLGISNRLFWRCPTQLLLDRYRRLVAPRHLEVGVGTGFFLDRAGLQPPLDLALADLNPNSLAHTAARVARFQPRVWELDLLDPIQIPEAPFGSIGLNFVLHCLPGPMPRKAVAFDHLLPLLRDDGVLFGATILNDLLAGSWMGRRVSAIYNRKGIFGNAQDTLPALREALTARFAEVKLDAVGAVGVFEARLPRRHSHSETSL